MITIPKSSARRTTPQSHADKSARGGMNNLTQPERLGPGVAQDVLNLFWDGDSLTSRPGMQGVLTSAHGAPVYACRYRYMKANGTALVIYSTGGKLYFHTTVTAGFTEITKVGGASFSFTSSINVQYTIHGKFLYFLDAGDSAGYVWRVNLESSTAAEAVRGLTAPTIAPLAALRDGAIVQSSLGTGTWITVSTTGGSLIPSGEEDFPSPTSTFWTYFGGATPGNNLDADGGSAPCVELDADTGAIDYVGFTAPVSLPSTAQRLVFVSARYAATENTGASDSAQVLRTTVYGCDSSGNRILAIAKDSTGANQYPTRVFEEVFDFRLYPQVVKIDVEFSCPTATGTKGVDVRQVSVLCPFPNYAQTNASGVSSLDQGDIRAWRGTLYTAGVAAKLDTATLNLSSYDSILADVKAGSSVISPLVMRLGFKVSSTVYYSLPTVVSGEMTAWDTSLIKSSLTAVEEVWLETTTDLEIKDLQSGGSTEVFSVSSLRVAGSLTQGSAISYTWTQVKASGTSYPSDVLFEGSGSPFSNVLVPSATQARVRLDLKGVAGAAPTLDSDTTHIAIYKLGGALLSSATVAHLVAMVPIGADATSPALSTLDQSANLYFWDSTNKVFYDNVPDDNLLSAYSYQLSRDMVPVGGTAITTHAGRLWISKYSPTYGTNTVYGSWLIDDLNTWPYMSEVKDVDDPDLITKGITLRVGGQGSGDRVVAFGTANLDTQGGNKGSALMVLRQQVAPAIISGDTPLNFALNSSNQDRSGGCLAAGGVENVNGATVYLAATGIQASQGFNLSPLSEAVQKRLSLNALGQSRYSQSFLVWHDSRIWCIVPGSGSTDGEALVLDNKDGGHGWGRITGYMGLGFTSACSLSGGSDSGDLYLGGRDGQLYRMSGTPYSPLYTSDKATPGGTARAISWSVTSRRFGQQDTQTRSTYTLNRPSALFFDFTAGSAFTLTTTVTNSLSQSVTLTFAHPTGRTQRSELREFGDLRGMTHEYTLSGATTAVTTLHSATLEVSDTGETR